jgi:acylglycerol lipase
VTATQNTTQSHTREAVSRFEIYCNIKALIYLQEKMSAAVKSDTVLIGGRNLCVHQWKTEAAASSNTACIIYHGFLAHGLYPTVRYAAEKLVSECYSVIAVDLPGHGQSEGLRGYLPNVEELLQIGVDIAEYAKSLLSSDNEDEKRLFLIGSSLGGAMALSVAHRMQSRVAGIILLAPMLRLPVDGVKRYLLQSLAYVLPTWQVIPSSSTDPKQQYRDPMKRKECEDDLGAVSGRTIRIGSASTCVELANGINEHFAEVTCPFLVMVADEDVVVDPQGSVDFYEQAGSEDKTIKRYAALHGLLCEPSPLIDTIVNDMIKWLNVRANKG